MTHQQIIPPHVWDIVVDRAATAVACSICGAQVEPTDACEHIAVSTEDGVLIVTQWTNGNLAVRPVAAPPQEPS